MENVCAGSMFEVATEAEFQASALPPDQTGEIVVAGDHVLPGYLDGIGNNIAFLGHVIAHPRFREGRLSTGFIDEEYPDGFGDILLRPEEPDLLADSRELRRVGHHRRASGEIIVAVELNFDATLFPRFFYGHLGSEITRKLFSQTGDINLLRALGRNPRTFFLVFQTPHQCFGIPDR